MKRPVDMTDQEYGKYIRDQAKDYALRYKVRKALLDKKIAQAKITVTDAEVEAEMKKA